MVALAGRGRPWLALADFLTSTDREIDDGPGTDPGTALGRPWDDPGPALALGQPWDGPGPVLGQSRTTLERSPSALGALSAVERARGTILRCFGRVAQKLEA